jgi:hypothetical protein
MFFLISGEDNAWKTPKYGEKPDKIGLFGQIVVEAEGFEPSDPVRGHLISRGKNLGFSLLALYIFIYLNPRKPHKSCILLYCHKTLYFVVWGSFITFL